MGETQSKGRHVGRGFMQCRGTCRLCICWGIPARRDPSHPSALLGKGAMATLAWPCPEVKKHAHGKRGHGTRRKRAFRESVPPRAVHRSLTGLKVSKDRLAPGGQFTKMVDMGDDLQCRLRRPTGRKT